MLPNTRCHDDSRRAAGAPVTCLGYRIDTSSAARGELEVRADLELAPPVPGQAAARAELDLFLPVWTPGSYLIREFARHLSRVAAIDLDSGRVLVTGKVSKNRFRIGVTAATRRVRVSYRVYAHDLSVRTADATAEHAYWNHACLLLWPVGQPRLPATIEVRFAAEWQLASALSQSPPTEIAGGYQTIALRADNLDDALDAPCLVGRFQRISWHTLGIEHAIVLDGLGPIAPPPSLAVDLDRVVQAAATVFGGVLPYQSYLFLCLFAADGYGGLEHGASTTLLFSRTELRTEKGYRDFLALAAHELFHAWNAKRLRPTEFWSYDYENENYTTFLWLIEGWTAYYDDLLCVRAGLLGAREYLAVAAKSIDAVLAAPGRMQLSLAESSFDAWLRLYRPDENTRNSSQNYYVNGSVAALLLDLRIRRSSNGECSLDHVIRHLYEATFQQGRGYRLDDVASAVSAVAGAEVWGAFQQLVTGMFEPDLEPLLRDFGITWRHREAGRPLLGVQFESHGTIVASVTANTPAHAAGVLPGDEILAVQGLRVDASRWQDVFSAVAAADHDVELLLARRGVVQRRTVQIQRSPGSVLLEFDPEASEQELKLRNTWLAGAKIAPLDPTKAP
jgi:predicted metalloprotease with PDZ domain